MLVGAVNCPVNSARVAMPCSTPLAGFFATPGTRGEDAVEEVLDFVALSTGTGSHSSVKFAGVDPMEEEALLCTPMPCRSDSDRPLAHSIDLWPRRARSPRVSSHGFVGAGLHERVQLFGACSIMGRPGRWAGSSSGPQLQ